MNELLSSASRALFFSNSPPLAGCWRESFTSGLQRERSAHTRVYSSVVTSLNNRDLHSAC